MTIQSTNVDQTVASVPSKSRTCALPGVGSSHLSTRVACPHALPVRTRARCNHSLLTVPDQRLGLVGDDCGRGLACVYLPRARSWQFYRGVGAVFYAVQLRLFGCERKGLTNVSVR